MADTFDYPTDDILNPKGKNGMGTRATFYQRSLYKQKVYPDAFPSPLDTWYDKLIYGRIDQFQNSVVPGLENMRTIPSAAMPNMRALNVVVDIFERFVAHMAKAVLASAVDTRGNSNLLNIKAVRAYESPNALYAQHIQGLYTTFVGQMKAKEKRGIRDFGSFIEFYKHYLLHIAAHVPVTKTNYLLSANCNMFNSGVCIAIGNEDAGDDFVKNEKYLTDPNFEFYRKCAKKFGFMVDKNVPWVLTADLFTTAFEDAALSRYATADGAPINRQNFFDVFYNPTCMTDFDDLKYMFINSYISLVNQDPFYEEETQGSNCAAVVSLPRTPLLQESASEPNASANQTNAENPPASNSAGEDLPPLSQDVRANLSGADVLTDRFLIDFYIDLRQTEVDSVLPPHQVKSLKSRAYEVYGLQPLPTMSRLQNVANFVNTVYRDRIYDIGALFLQVKNAKLLDNRVKGGTILVENDISRQLY